VDADKDTTTMSNNTHHFIISYNTVDKEWIHDVEQEEEVYLDGTILLNSPSGMHFGEMESGYKDGVLNPMDDNLCQQLNKMLEKLNAKERIS